MGLFNHFHKNHNNYRNRNFSKPDSSDNRYEFCPRCEANLTMQKGYRNDLPYWTCLGCGEMLINPRINEDIVWLCDGCNALLNEQPGFSQDIGLWICSACGYENRIDVNDVFQSEEERDAVLSKPFSGLSDSDLVSLLSYEEIENLQEREDITLVKDEDGHLYVRKILSIYDESIYRHLMAHPVAGMPAIKAIYKGTRKLIVIEEYIDGLTLSQLLDRGNILPEGAVRIVMDLCVILRDLHSQDNPIIHRDVKPSNVIVDEDLKVYLLDVNVAKWYKDGEKEDTRMLGTRYFAAPEQLGYGFAASSPKTDIYALGMLLNILITGKLPKEEKAPDGVWYIVERCISLNPDERPGDDELIGVLESYLDTYDQTGD